MADRRWRVCVVTTSRADYGLLRSVMAGIRRHPRLHLQVVVTGSHLVREFGHTVEALRADRVHIDRTVEALLASDTGVGMAKSVGLATIGMADAFDSLRPDCVVVLGDRYELLAPVQAAFLLSIPVAHIAGGDLTRGALDDSVRHAVTKLSHLHLVTNPDAARRVRQMGEDPARVFTVGSPGLDAVRDLRPWSRRQLTTKFGLRFRGRMVLATYHPVTRTADGGPVTAASLRECRAMLTALGQLGEEVGIVVTRPNADAGGRAIIELIDTWAAGRPAVQVFSSLGTQGYLSLLRAVDVVVGNSSSGLYEAPSFGIPTVNIGARQADRLRATSVLDAKPTAVDITRAIQQALALDCRGTVNPYGDGRSGARIASVLASTLPRLRGLQKPFHEEASRGRTRHR